MFAVAWDIVVSRSAWSANPSTVASHVPLGPTVVTFCPAHAASSGGSARASTGRRATNVSYALSGSASLHAQYRELSCS